MTYDEQIEHNAPGVHDRDEDLSLLCDSCKHSFSHHMTPYGSSLACDAHVTTWETIEGMIEEKVRFCGCPKFIFPGSDDMEG